MTDVPQLDDDVRNELMWASAGEKWSNNADDRFNGFECVQSNLVDCGEWSASYETIFTMDLYPGRYFRLCSEGSHRSGDHEVDDFVTEVFPHATTIIKYREAR